VIVVDDHSNDGTAAVVEQLGRQLGTVRCLPSPYNGGFGLTVRAGL
jgi:glycosyltransferase involved in cell wall biosynthesis